MAKIEAKTLSTLDSVSKRGPCRPLQLRAGDRFTDAQGEWEAIRGPWSMAAGKTVYAYVQRPGEVGRQREAFWAAHEKIAVRRRADAPKKPPGDPDPATTIETLQAELRWLRGEALGLQDEKRALEQRLSHLMQELEKTRAKVSASGPAPTCSSPRRAPTNPPAAVF